MALKPFTLYAKFKNWTLFSVASVLEVNKNSIVFRLARHLCSSTPLFYLYILCMDIRKAFLYFDPRVFVLVWLSTPFQTSLNKILRLSISTRITLEIELFTFLNSFAGAVQT